MTATTPGNPYLVADAPDPSGFSVSAADATTGVSELTDVQGLYQDIFNEHDALAGVFDAGGFALDVLGDIGDPLGAVIGCAVGWIVEHVSFLREPVDWLAGDPGSIEASVATWNNVGTGMKHAAQRYVADLNSLTGKQWSGEAADVYRRHAAEWVEALDHAGTMAEIEGVLIAATGGLCAAFRGTIFTAISEALERWVMVGLVALANSAWTFGASVAGWIVDVEIDAGLLAARLSAKIAELVGKAGRIAETLGKDGGKLEEIGQKLVRLSERMEHNVRSSRALLGHDRRRADAGSQHAVRDADHLRSSLSSVDKIFHPGTVGTVLGTTKDVSEAAVHHDADHVDDAVSGATNSAAKTGVKAVKESVTGERE